VQAWEDTSINPNDVAARVIQPLFHPSNPNTSCPIHASMTAVLQSWLESYEKQEQDDILDRLTRDQVQAHKNDRLEGLKHDSGSFSRTRTVNIFGEGLSENPMGKLTPQRGRRLDG